jgi:Trk-type K+ transport system membrane component
MAEILIALCFLTAFFFFTLDPVLIRFDFSPSLREVLLLLAAVFVVGVVVVMVVVAVLTMAEHVVMFLIFFLFAFVDDLRFPLVDNDDDEEETIFFCRFDFSLDSLK